ncbi:GMC family oxidoreductase [Altericroceibacterium endophyticum]|uniref:Choline dehydrogenase n=1 Tax=Altericroceibacterium endophyticum TaxID=1808508 RepID=A0A6I4T4L4_9SPHN|nr:choline dehydrogenase [Altericroceibacterium endophyticum]MXO65152.1 choline dehydrogenase [Altericroceibacterium endophyticum]
MSAADSFDYIIVGAGSAGCVLANRLSADPTKRVLLLEAGGSHKRFYLTMPMAFLRALMKPEFTWGYMSEPEPHLNGRRIPLPRGKVLGGSSSINGMFYMRGHSRDFDGWRQMGCTGWGYDSVLPYFRRMEDSWRGENEYHGDKGPLSVVAVDTEKRLHHPLMDSAEAAGYSTSDDLAGEVEEGFARGELTIDRKGRRHSTARAYLEPAMERSNLTIITGAKTRRVLMDGKRAIGVEYLHEDELKTAHAKGEVILSGGSYNSPQLLMLSGIGPAEHLTDKGIAVQHDLPGVGRNLSEHPRVPLTFKLKKPVSFLNELRLDRVVRSVARWALSGKGAFASQLNSANIILRSREGLEQPDIQLFANPIRLDAQIWFPGWRKKQEDQIIADVILLHPASRGWMELRSADPDDSPAITLNNFADPEDFATARRGIEIARKVYRTEPQAELTGDEVVPGADLTSEQELNDYIRRTAGVTQHPVGTCTMGQGPMAVVDPELRVHGLEGLRVVDASIMPTVPGANTNAATIMIAEKASDMILGKAPLPAEDPRDQTRDTISNSNAEVPA